MLSDEQIKEEAKKRISNMSPSRRAQIEKDINETLDMNEYVSKKGYLNLTPEEQGKFHKLQSKNMNRGNAGGVINASVESSIMKKLNVSREEIRNMKKNPFKAKMYKQVLLTVLANLGLVATAGIAKATGADLTAAYPILSGLSGFFALGFGNQLVNAVRFRNLQKSYDRTDYQDKEIEAEVYREIREEVEKGRSR